MLAADAAPHRGIYQPLLAAAPPSPDALDRLKWPDHHAADLRHIQRFASVTQLHESSEVSPKHNLTAMLLHVLNVLHGQCCLCLLVGLLVIVFVHGPRQRLMLQCLMAWAFFVFSLSACPSVLSWSSDLLVFPICFAYCIGPSVGCSLCMSVWLPTCPYASVSTLESLSSIKSCFTCRCADKGQLVEVRNHDWWGAPALGTLGPPAAAVQGSIGHQPVQQQSRSVSCCWCKAEDHLVKDCPLNAYLDEQMEDSSKPDAHLAQNAGKKCWSGLHYMRKDMTR